MLLELVVVVFSGENSRMLSKYKTITNKIHFNCKNLQSLDNLLIGSECIFLTHHRQIHWKLCAMMHAHHFLLAVTPPPKVQCCSSSDAN
ncbi:hypothetical protein Syun_028905 [Stephania yunnanensis]|uniref:Uncharacterized protein n=1 Tax=Stephania yunnanensis TaxID=152371 RepID=A0AAP0E4N2_9MAGN